MKRFWWLFCVVWVISGVSTAADYLVEKPSAADFPLVTKKWGTATLVVEDPNQKGVQRAAADLQMDIERVTGQKPKLLTQLPKRAKAIVLIGEWGQSALIEHLVDTGKLTVSNLIGQWEGYTLAHVERPFEHIDHAWVIVGADKRGTIFGIYDLSETIGVSPWYWWADVPPNKASQLYLKHNTMISDAPKVKYRGIFLNDEAPALTSWSAEKFGGYNAKFYRHVFELLLRLKANFLWPAMWNNAFADDDPMNAVLANEMGIVMSTSHHEPMMRADKEWNRYGKGPWEYSTNPDNLYEFWKQGAKRHRELESIFTLGMRGQEDTPMSEGQNIELLENIVADQRKILAETFVDKDVSDIPQVWTLYKEVQGFYERGMRVPDDVTLLWADDNFGNIRRLPTQDEQNRSGGAGVYYHFDYVGSPRSYRWINTVPLAKIWEQMDLAYRYGARQIWITNVGDLKPMELPIDFFLTMAWDPESMDANSAATYHQSWAAQQFGEKHAQEIGQLLDIYTRHNGRRKPEAVEPDTYSVLHYQEAETVSAMLSDAAQQAQRIAQSLAKEAQDSFFQLVSYPLWASQAVFEMNRHLALNRLYGEQTRSVTNLHGDKALYWFERDAQLAERYHSMADGRWNHMMSQPHIGFVHWRNPPANLRPAVVRYDTVEPAVADMGVAIEGSRLWWPANQFQDKTLTLDTFYPFGQQQRKITVYNRQAKPFKFEASATQPWVKLSSVTGQVSDQVDIEVSIDFSQLAEGQHHAQVNIVGTGWGAATIEISAQQRDTTKKPTGYLEADGYVSVLAASGAIEHCYPQACWKKIPAHGRFAESVAAFTTPFVSYETLQPKPQLVFPIWVETTGKHLLRLQLAPSLQFDPHSKLKFAIRLDDTEPVVLSGLGDGSYKQWQQDVLNGVRFIETEIEVQHSGYHELFIELLDPGVVLQKLTLFTRPEKPSYLGSPESRYQPR